MPELPEVEILRLQLTELLLGQTVKDIQILKKRSFVGDTELVIGAEVVEVRRFGKILFLNLDNGLSLAVHLKLTGQLIYKKVKSEKLKVKSKKAGLTDSLLENLPNKHTRVIVVFESGDKLFFNDMRMFGWMKIVKSQKSKVKSQNYNLRVKSLLKLEDLVENLGPEPLKDLTLAIFRKTLKSSQKPIKLLIMDQKKIAGVGNIYANESLFLAKIHPKTPASEISEKQAEVLYHKLLSSLKKGIKLGGASDQHFRDLYGRKGKVQKHFLVYGKEGEKCINNCTSKIKKIKLGGRGAYFCPKCQKF